MTFLSLAEAKIGGYLPVQATLSEVRRIMMLNEPSLRSDSAFFITESTWPELVFVGLDLDFGKGPRQLSRSPLGFVKWSLKPYDERLELVIQNASWILESEEPSEIVQEMYETVQKSYPEICMIGGVRNAILSDDRVSVDDVEASQGHLTWLIDGIVSMHVYSDEESTSLYISDRSGKRLFSKSFRTNPRTAGALIRSAKGAIMAELEAMSQRIAKLRDLF
jgi:hypothetical protein